MVYRGLARGLDSRIGESGVTMSDVTERLRDEHDSLRHHQGRLRDCVERYRQRPNRDNLLALRDLCESFGKCLDRHLEFEEDGGYLVEVRERRPRSAREVERLFGEHGQLRERAATLVTHLQEAAAGTDDLPTDFVEQFSSFMDFFGQHEATERELVLDVFWTDGGRSRTGLEE